jgi:hypothetical protein
LKNLFRNYKIQLLFLTENGTVKTIDKATERILGMKALVNDHIFCLSPYVENVSLFPNPRINIKESDCFEKELTFNKPYSSAIH